MIDNSYKEKDNQIKFETNDEIKLRKKLSNESKVFNELSAIKIKIFMLTEKYVFSKRRINAKKELIGLFLFLITYLYYYLSLESCLKGEEICSILFQWQITKIYQELKSCFIMVLIFELIFYKLLSKLHIIHFLLIFLAFYRYSNGNNFEDHGYYNFVYFFIITFLIIILIIPLNFFVYIMKNGKKMNYLFKIILSLIMFIYSCFFFIYSKGSNCDDWGKGLNSTSIINNNSIYGCQIQFPKKCSYKLFYFFQDFTKIMKKNCSRQIKKNPKDNLIKYSSSPFITKETKLFGYPLSNKDPVCIKDENGSALQNNFLINLVDMENEQILDKYFKNKKPEVLVDFTNDTQGKIEINVHYDKILSKQRKLLEKNSEPLSNNVLVIFIDSVSRQNAIRELKKTLEFFKKFMSYKGGTKEKYSNENYHSFEFFKYHAFKGHTSINYPLLFYGQNREIEEKHLINKYFKKNGYITSLAIDICKRDNTNSNHKFILDEIFDHEFILCDPNKDHINLSTIRCLYGKLDIEHLLSYSEKFWRKYYENRKFSLIVSNFGHEGTLQVIKYIDNLISSFLWNLYDDNLLRNSVVFLISDHGTEMPSIYYIDSFYKIEADLPMFYIFLSDKKNSSYEQQYKYMYENQQNLITAFDFYNTLCNIIFGDKYKYIRSKTSKKDTCKSPYGESLFNKINNNKDRHPKNFNKIAQMSLNVCK